MRLESGHTVCFLVALLERQGHAICNSATTIVRERVMDSASVGSKKCALVWEGPRNEGLGNALLGFGNAYYNAIRLNCRLMVSQRARISSALIRAFELGLETTLNKMQVSDGGFAYEGLPEEEAVHYFGQKHVQQCHTGRLDRHGVLFDSWALSVSKFPCGLQAALRRLIVGPSNQLRSFGERHWQGNRDDLHALMLHPNCPVFLAAIHVRLQMRWVEQRLTEDSNASVAEISAFLHSPKQNNSWFSIANDLHRLIQATELPAGKRHAVYVASESAVVCRSLSAFLESRLPVNVSHIDNGRGRGHTRRRLNPTAENRSNVEPDLAPFLDWYALAHADVILARRHTDLRFKFSTFSHTAFAYGFNFARNSSVIANLTGPFSGLERKRHRLLSPSSYHT